MLSNLACVPSPGRPGGAHAKASTRFLTDISPPTSETWLDAGHLDGSDPREADGRIHAARRRSSWPSNRARRPARATSASPAPTPTRISWLGASTPLPTENNPRTVFERLFGDSRQHRSHARGSAASGRIAACSTPSATKWRTLQGALGPGDRAKLVEYLDAIRDVERRIQKAEEQSGKELPRVDQPAGIPATYDEHVRLMCDLQVLAYQTDLTRVVTFMLGREFSGVTYPQIGVPDAHHPITHHQQEAEKIAKVVKINHYHVDAVRLPAREAALDAGRRRLAARSRRS